MPNQHTTKGKPKRKRVVSVRYSDSEHERVSTLAAKAGKELSEHIRQKSLEDTVVNATRGKGE